MNKVREQCLFAYDVGKLLQYSQDSKLIITLGESYRTPEQAAIYAKEGKGVKNSLHCDRLAIDINLFDHDLNLITDSSCFKALGSYWKSLSSFNRWGGDFKKVDGNHFERNV